MRQLRPISEKATLPPALEKRTRLQQPNKIIPNLRSPKNSPNHTFTQPSTHHFSILLRFGILPLYLLLWFVLGASRCEVLLYCSNRPFSLIWSRASDFHLNHRTTASSGWHAIRGMGPQGPFNGLLSFTYYSFFAPQWCF